MLSKPSKTFNYATHKITVGPNSIIGPYDKILWEDPPIEYAKLIMIILIA